MSKATDLIRMVEESELMGKGGKYSKYRDKEGKLCGEAEAVMVLVKDPDGGDANWHQYSKGKVGKKIDWTSCGRRGRDKRPYVDKRCYDGKVQRTGDKENMKTKKGTSDNWKYQFYGFEKKKGKK